MRQQITSLPALQCFRVAAEEESFSKAAERLNLTHGAISRAVRLLESDLGTLLFERRNRAVFLTPAGRDLARVVSEGFAQIETTIAAIKANTTPPPLTVSCEPTLMMRWLIPRLPLFRHAHPEIPVNLVAGGGAVRLGPHLQLAIRRNDFVWPEHYGEMRLFDEMIGPVCRPDIVQNVFEDGQPTGQAVLLHTRTRPSAWESWLTLSNLSVRGNPEQTFDHFYFSLQAAIAGLGVAIGSSHLVRDDLATGILTAPAGFIADGSSYVLLSEHPIKPGSPEAIFADWLAGISKERENYVS